MCEIGHSVSLFFKQIRWSDLNTSAAEGIVIREVLSK